MRLFWEGLGSSRVADVRASVLLAVAVEKFSPVPARWHAHHVPQSGNGREVANDEHGILPRLAFAQQRYNAHGRVIAIHPFKTLGIVIEPVQRIFAAIRSEEHTS